jgi:oxygen-independent coproporphyrinogen-3 oxidase
LLQAGYREVGMDHFALPGDELFTSLEKGQLHRNFMGYTTQHTELILGLGVSAISDTGNAFAQNHKTLHDYYAAIERGECAVTRGYFLDDTDIAIRRYITEISCNGFTGFDERDLCMLREKCFEKLQDLAADGLIEWDESGLRVTDTGRRFTRNICSAFDLYLKPSESPGVFSKAI